MQKLMSKIRAKKDRAATITLETLIMISIVAALALTVGLMLNSKINTISTKVDTVLTEIDTQITSSNP